MRVLDSSFDFVKKLPSLKSVFAASPFTRFFRPPPKVKHSTLWCYRFLFTVGQMSSTLDRECMCKQRLLEEDSEWFFFVFLSVYLIVSGDDSLHGVCPGAGTIGTSCTHEWPEKSLRRREWKFLTKSFYTHSGPIRLSPPIIARL